MFLVYDSPDGNVENIYPAEDVYSFSEESLEISVGKITSSTGKLKKRSIETYHATNEYLIQQNNTQSSQSHVKNYDLLKVAELVIDNPSKNILQDLSNQLNSISDLSSSLNSGIDSSHDSVRDPDYFPPETSGESSVVSYIILDLFGNKIIF